MSSALSHTALNSLIIAWQFCLCCFCFECSVLFFFLLRFLTFRAGKLRITFRFVAAVSCSINYAYAALVVPKLAHISRQRRKWLKLNFDLLFIIFKFVVYICVCARGICCSAAKAAARTRPRDELATRTDRTAYSTALRRHLTATATATSELCVFPLETLPRSLSHTLTHRCTMRKCTMYNGRAGGRRKGPGRGQGKQNY